MKRFLFLMLLGFSINVHAQIKKGQEPYMTKSVSGESVKDVEVETSGGSIDVTGGNTSNARVEVYVNRNDNRLGIGELSKEEIQKRLDEDYNLDVSVNNGKVTAKARPKHNNMDWKRALSISFRIYVPESVSTDLSTSGGSITLANLSGEQRFSTSGGNLNLDGISGKTKGSTSGGSIYVKNSKDDLNLSTSGGNIEASECSGKLHLTTSGGSLRLSNLKGDIDAGTSGGNVKGSNIEGELTAHTSGGNVDLQDLTCSLEASTSGGNIDVAIKQPGKFIRLSNSGGNISLQLPRNTAADLDIQARRVNTGKLENFSGSIEEESVKGKLNGGGVSISAAAGSGRVSLSFQ